jgi:ribosomal protein S6
VYEAGYHISPLVKEEDIEKIVSEIRSVVEKGGGSFIAEGAPALMKLAYEIEGREGSKKHFFDRGYFGWLKFESSSETADTLTRSALEKHASVFRSMVFPHCPRGDSCTSQGPAASRSEAQRHTEARTAKVEKRPLRFQK